MSQSRLNTILQDYYSLIHTQQISLVRGLGGLESKIFQMVNLQQPFSSNVQYQREVDSVSLQDKLITDPTQLAFKSFRTDQQQSESRKDISTILLSMKKQKKIQANHVVEGEESDVNLERAIYINSKSSIHIKAIRPSFYQNQTSQLDSILQGLNSGSRIDKIEYILNAVVQNHNQNEPFLMDLKDYIRKVLPEFKHILDIMIEKFDQQQRSREEIIKYLIRRTFKAVYKKIQFGTSNQILIKEAHNICLKEYFDQKAQNDLEVLPFRKDSRLKSMNRSFLDTVFQSIKFQQEYKEFHNQLRITLLKDNEVKIKNLAQYFFSNQYQHEKTFDQKLKKIKGFPWTFKNIDETIKISQRIVQQFAMNQTSELI